MRSNHRIIRNDSAKNAIVVRTNTRSSIPSPFLVTRDRS
jgi:hypothetical protein